MSGKTGRYTDLKIRRDKGWGWMKLNRIRKKERWIELKPWENSIFNVWLENDVSTRKEKRPERFKDKGASGIDFWESCKAVIVGIQSLHETVLAFKIVVN